MPGSGSRASRGDQARARHRVLLWFATGTLAFLLGLYELPATLLNDGFVPVGHDSFYHAHRMLDAVPDLSGFDQFDPDIHAPEGSWITWPWAYDFLAAALARGMLATGLVTQPMSVLAFIAPLTAYVSAALLLGICMQLRLGAWVSALVMFCFASSRLTHWLHHVGMLDHHFVEQIFVLAVLYSGLRWMGAPPDRRRAAMLGTVLGLAPAFHNGNFVLQLPVIATLGLLWLRHASPPRPAMIAFAVALLLSTALALLPSEPFRRLMFSFTLHSWFHLYVATCTAGAALAFALVRATPRSALSLAILAGIFVAPLVREAQIAHEFLAAELLELGSMGEASSLAEALVDSGPRAISTFYSCLVWLLLPGLAWLCLSAARAPHPQRVLLAVCSVGGVALLLLQLRLQYFGAFALWLTPALAGSELIARAPAERRRLLQCGLATLMIGSMLPGIRAYTHAMPLGNDAYYEGMRPVLLRLAEACEASPGVVLADNNLGHYISFHTRCAVISNNFIVTRQHEEKLLLTARLMNGSVEQLAREAPWVRYVLVDGLYGSTDGPSAGCSAHCTQASIRQRLKDAGSPAPEGWRLLAELRLEAGENAATLARLFELPPPP